ncbi:plastocyanin/azurin family copper-binding protein [Salinilacihabitans rarus]|uniref:plastocyanin/azurin family copper-binding protein n=1 Tax=Salinilacihabitans rarus TaxID=2961596 RepID=UPI00272CDFAA|nr:plastocyanin/azurin family copper-binding protein [Salinilacihabitans rarus]
MERRAFVVAAGGLTASAAAAAVAGPVAGQDEGGGDGENGGGQDGDGGAGNESQDGGDETAGGQQGGDGGGGATEEVIVGPGGENVFEPETLTIEPGTTVVFRWDSDNHNVHPTSVPDGAEWEGHLDIENEGFEYEHTFETEGTYEYQCDPHVSVGMVGTVEVGTQEAAAAGGEVDIHDVGVPIQKHFVGLATFLAIFVSLVFTFYLLKYGESAHTSSPGRK